jgi:hypothetical protein
MGEEGAFLYNDPIAIATSQSHEEIVRIVDESAWIVWPMLLKRSVLVRRLSYRTTERVVRRWHSLRVIARRALSVRRRRARHAASTLARAWLAYSHAPVPGRPGYKRVRSDFLRKCSKHLGLADDILVAGEYSRLPSPM